MSPTLMYMKARRVRRIKTSIALALITAGAITAMLLYRPARIPDLEQINYGNWKDLPAKVTGGESASVLLLQLLFIVGYGLVLVGFGYLYRWWATTSMEYVPQASRWVLLKPSRSRGRISILGSAASRPLIDTVHYVISVSGGGFTAGARLLATQPLDKDTAPDGRGRGGTAGRPVEDPEPLLLSERFGKGSAEFDHFRRGSSYIFDTPGELVGALAVVLGESDRLAGHPVHGSSSTGMVLRIPVCAPLLLVRDVRTAQT